MCFVTGMGSLVSAETRHSAITSHHPGRTSHLETDKQVIAIFDTGIAQTKTNRLGPEMPSGI